MQHVPNNHTNLFQPLSIPAIKGVMSFLSNKYQDWYANQVCKQMERSVESYDVKVDVTLTKLKSLRTGWVMDYHKEI